MEEFKVRIVETWDETIPIRANDSTEAYNKANENYENGNFQFGESTKAKCEIRVVGK